MFSNVLSANNPIVTMEPYHQLDLVYGRRVYKDMSMKLKLRNLLDSEVQLMENALIHTAYKKGVSASLGLSVSL